MIATPPQAGGLVVTHQPLVCTAPPTWLGRRRAVPLPREGGDICTTDTVVTTQSTLQAKPAAPYFGGKRLLAARIIERLNAIPHTCYLEPFVGMGGVFLRRPAPSRSEVINDLSGDIVVLFRVIQRHLLAFQDMLKWQLTAREEFERLVRQQPDSLTDLERAARFLYLQRTAFGGKVTGRTFGVSKTGPARFDTTTLFPVLASIHDRLARVVIERQPWQRVIERYDSPDTLIYLDPPYWGCEADYGEGLFSREDFAALAAVLGSIQGRFVLSLNDTPEVRALFRSFKLEPVALRYSVSRGRSTAASELVISN